MGGISKAAAEAKSAAQAVAEDKGEEDARVVTGHTGAVLSVCFDHAGKKLASGGGDGDKSVRLWSTETGAPIGSPWTGHSDP
jgi:WD40 repeat protein